MPWSTEAVRWWIDANAEAGLRIGGLLLERSMQQAGAIEAAAKN